MKVTLATTASYFWGPQAEHFAQELHRQGRDASTTSKGSPTSIQPDLLFCIGTGESLAPMLDRHPARFRILYLIESIPSLTESDEFTRAKLKVHQPYLQAFDYIFVHSRRSIPILLRIGVQHVEELIWPHFPALFFPVTATKDIDLLFLGTASPHRIKLLQRLASSFSVVHQNAILHEKTGALYGRAKIVLNLHFTPLRNLECRVIEALGCGAFVMTEELEPADVFRDRQHLVVFDEANMFKLVEEYLRNDCERERIATAGHAELQRYDVEYQVRRILQVAQRFR